jgi:hypothetical protein
MRTARSTVTSENLTTKMVYRRPKTLPARIATNRPPLWSTMRLRCTAAATPRRRANGTDREIIHKIVAVSVHDRRPREYVTSRIKQLTKNPTSAAIPKRDTNLITTFGQVSCQ